MPDTIPQKGIDFGFHLRHRLIGDLVVWAGRETIDRRPTAGKFDEFGAHLANRDREIDKTRRNGAVRHIRRAWAKTVRNLGECQTITFLDGLKAKRAISVAAGQ